METICEAFESEIVNCQIVPLLVLLVNCIPCAAEETKYPPVLQRLQESYEPLRLQQKKQLDAVKKIATEMEAFNAKLEAKKPRDPVTVTMKVDPKASVGAELDGLNRDNKPQPGRDDGSLFNLSIRPFLELSTGGMGGWALGGMGGYGGGGVPTKPSTLSPFRANQIVLFETDWAGYAELIASHKAQTYAFAQIVAEKLTRDDLEQIVEYSWNDVLLRKSEAVGFLEFASAVATEIALRETSNQKMRVVIATSPVSSGLGPFLIDLYHDERSFKALSRMANSKSDFIGRQEGSQRLMLGYDAPADFRAKLEAKKASKQSLADHEKRLLASWSYADSLLPQEKPKYLDFERRFHVAFCISPRDDNHSLSHFLNYGASHFRWKDGDDQFLLHEAENALNDFYSRELIRMLEAYLKPGERARLEAMLKR